jgi:hypothetical protein
VWRMQMMGAVRANHLHVLTSVAISPRICESLTK